MDNLQSMTYEMFEKDPVKYSQYEKVRLPCLKIYSLALNTIRGDISRSV